MYERYWKLGEQPFRNTAHPRFLYYSKKHDEALVRLLYAVSESKGLMVLTGDVGTGKSYVCKLFMKELLEKGYRVAMPANPDLAPIDFLQQILCELGREYRGKSQVELWQDLVDFMVQTRKQNSETVLLIDEAQLISDRRTFELIRLLLNLELEERFLLTIVLVGQPELWQRIRQMPPLNQRLGLSYRLAPLTLEETRGYIGHRLEVAGAANGIFTDEAINEIHTYARGLPREINNICDLSLLIGCGEEATEITSALVQQAVEDFRGSDFIEQRKYSAT